MGRMALISRTISIVEDLLCAKVFNNGMMTERKHSRYHHSRNVLHGREKKNIHKIG